jgi:hypothetical protein
MLSSVGRTRLLCLIKKFLVYWQHQSSGELNGSRVKGRRPSRSQKPGTTSLTWTLAFQDDGRINVKYLIYNKNDLRRHPLTSLTYCLSYCRRLVTCFLISLKLLISHTLLNKQLIDHLTDRLLYRKHIEKKLLSHTNPNKKHEKHQTRDVSCYISCANRFSIAYFRQSWYILQFLKSNGNNSAYCVTDSCPPEFTKTPRPRWTGHTRSAVGYSWRAEG